MPQDAEHNSIAQPIDTPVLYMSGDADHRSIDPYLRGLSKAGVNRLQGKTIARSGELLSIEAPDPFVSVLLAFADSLIF